VVAAIRAARGRGVPRGGAIAMVLGLLFQILAARGAGSPRINDFSTDLAYPPEFMHAQSLPANAGRDLGYPRSYAVIQRACCADVLPARVPLDRDTTFEVAREVAERMPSWTITQADPKTALIEAVATTRLFGFQDDIVIRVRPETAKSTRVDMRSKSRDGKGDIGANAARIRTYIATVEAAAKSRAASGTPPPPSAPTSPPS